MKGAGSLMIHSPMGQHHPAITTINSIPGALQLWPVWTWLARQDIKARYRGSFLGPLWLVLNLGILVGGLSLVYGAVFDQPLHIYAPYLTAGFMIWWFISGAITDSCAAFTANSQLIRNQPLPIGIYVLQVITRHSLLLAHNLLVFIVIALIFGLRPSPATLLVIPGFVAVAAILATSGLSLAIICARFRDIPHFVTNILQIAMLVTPIMFFKSMLGSRAALAQFNPFFHLVDAIRSPLTGEAPGISTWGFLVLANILSALFAFWLMRRAGHRVAYLV